MSGLIPIRDLGKDFWELDENGLALVGRDSGETYSIGKEIDVQIVAVDIYKAEVNLSLATPAEKKTKTKKRKDAKSKGSLKISDYL